MKKQEAFARSCSSSLDASNFINEIIKKGWTIERTNIEHYNGYLCLLVIASKEA